LVRQPGRCGSSAAIAARQLNFAAFGHRAARNVGSLPARLATLVAARLIRLGVDHRLVDAEIDAMATVAIEPTISKSVLGSMVDFAKGIPYYLTPGQWNEASLVEVEDRLAETPCRVLGPSDRVIVPERSAPQLLEKWLTKIPVQPTSGAAVH
jgi:hypothetical protein